MRIGPEPSADGPTGAKAGGRPRPGACPRPRAEAFTREETRHGSPQDHLRWALAAAALLGARPASADPIQFTGNVENDFSLAPGGGVTRVVDSPLPDGSPDPNHVPQAPWMTAAGLITGWSIKDIRLSYDQATDTMAVGVNFFGVAGDADGNGNPGLADARTTAVGGLDTAAPGRAEVDLRRLRHRTAAARPRSSRASRPTRAPPARGLDGFTVAAYKETGQGLAYDYGKTLTNNLGGLAFDPSKAQPGFEFTIKNFSTLPGFSASKGFNLSVFAGSPDDVVAGEDAFSSRHVSIPAAQTVTTPEPATLLGWAAVAGLAGLRARRRRLANR